jgi:hypothetical protein
VLQCFPKIESLAFELHDPLPPGEGERVVDLFRARGGTLKVLRGEGAYADALILFAVGTGALPKLSYFRLQLQSPVHRRSLLHGRLGALEEVDIYAEAWGDPEQNAALERLRHLPHLRSIRLHCRTFPEAALPLPAFIPPSLKSLEIDVPDVHDRERLLADLPAILQVPSRRMDTDIHPMLTDPYVLQQASGARLERLRVTPMDALFVSGGAALARVLTIAAPTLKEVFLETGCPSERATLEIASGLARWSESLERASVVWSVFSRLPPDCARFTRLTELSLGGGHVTRGASRVCEIMASGRLPALARLTMPCPLSTPMTGPGEGGLVRAFGGIAGTLTHLTIAGDGTVTFPEAACYELGAAIAQLRCLRHLCFSRVFVDGHAYHAVGRALAASGGCPSLSELRVLNSGLKNAQQLTHSPSIIVPSVRNLEMDVRCTDDELLMLCCALVVHRGYCHTLRVPLGSGRHKAPTVASARLMCRLLGINLVGM